MSSTSALPPTPVEQPLPRLRGRGDLIQGAYGDHGNLELVAPADDRGFWVFWWNADTVEHRSGAAVGEWSRGLHVDDGPLDQVRITQMRSGPKFLEVLALGAGSITRHCWTPEGGFQPCGTLPSVGARAVSRLVETDDTAHVLVVESDGSTTRYTADLARYPELTWIAAPILDNSPVGGASEVVGDARVSLDEDGQVWYDEGSGDGRSVGVPLWPERRWDSLAATATRLPSGDRVDLVLGVQGCLWHAHGSPAQGWSEPVPIVSRVWPPGSDD